LNAQRLKTERLRQELAAKEQQENALLRQAPQPVASAPAVIISTPEDGQRFEAATIRLEGLAEDRDGIARLEVRLNGQEVPLAYKGALPPGPPVRVNFETRLSLQPGANHIHLRATSINRLVSDKSLTVQHDPLRRRLHAVIVGINDYPHLPKLKYAVNDAELIYDFLVNVNGIPAQNVTLLLNEQAGIRSLRTSLGTALRAAAGPEDMVIIYFAGHGGAERDSESPDGDGLEKYLLAYDSIPGDLYSSALPMRELSYILKRIRSERLVLIADACYSGASGGRTTGVLGARATLSDNFLDRLAGGRGRVILTASGPNEVSVEKDELRQGVFTYYFLEGLRGPADADQDGMITVDEAYRYVSDKVPQATGQEQHPVKKGVVEGRLALSILR
jgi:hypothetical protein